MQPVGSATQVSPLPLAQRFAPRVHDVVQAWQVPLVQVEFAGQVLLTQVLQPMAVSSWQT